MVQNLLEGNLAQLDCTVQSVYTNSGESRAGISARAYALQSDGNEVLAQALVLEFATFRQSTCVMGIA